MPHTSRHSQRVEVDIRLTNFAGDSDIDLDRGNLTLRLPAKSVFTLDLDRSRRGAFHTDFPVLDPRTSAATTSAAT